MPFFEADEPPARLSSPAFSAGACKHSPLQCNLAARGNNPVGRVASAAGARARSSDDCTAGHFRGAATKLVPDAAATPLSNIGPARICPKLKLLVVGDGPASTPPRASLSAQIVAARSHGIITTGCYRSSLFPAGLLVALRIALRRPLRPLQNPSAIPCLGNGVLSRNAPCATDRTAAAARICDGPSSPMRPMTPHCAKSSPTESSRKCRAPGNCRRTRSRAFQSMYVNLAPRHQSRSRAMPRMASKCTTPRDAPAVT